MSREEAQPTSAETGEYRNNNHKNIITYHPYLDSLTKMEKFTLPLLSLYCVTFAPQAPHSLLTQERGRCPDTYHASPVGK